MSPVGGNQKTKPCLARAKYQRLNLSLDEGNPPPASPLCRILQLGWRHQNRFVVARKIRSTSPSPFVFPPPKGNIKAAESRSSVLTLSWFPSASLAWRWFPPPALLSYQSQETALSQRRARIKACLPPQSMSENARASFGMDISGQPHFVRTSVSNNKVDRLADWRSSSRASSRQSMCGSSFAPLSYAGHGHGFLNRNTFERDPPVAQRPPHMAHHSQPAFVVSIIFFG